MQRYVFFFFQIPSLPIINTFSATNYIGLTTPKFSQPRLQNYPRLTRCGALHALLTLQAQI